MKKYTVGITFGFMIGSRLVMKSISFTKKLKSWLVSVNSHLVKFSQMVQSHSTKQGEQSRCGDGNCIQC